MKSKDPLFLMNVVDLIPKLAHTRLGIEHIFDSGVLNLLLSLSEGKLELYTVHSAQLNT
jgi:hypothetical protein